MVILIVLPFQGMKPAVTGIGVVDILPADGTGTGSVAVDQVKDFLIEFFPLIMRNGFIPIDIFHWYHLANIWFLSIHPRTAGHKLHW